MIALAGTSRSIYDESKRGRKRAAVQCGFAHAA